ncbi:hypothetical protein FCH79_16840 [Pseudomonas koreensis]|nr:hypothetical protein [Pseudomonas koreensis]
MLNTHDIRGPTLLALPADDGYVYRLGVALYGFASISSFLAEVTFARESCMLRLMGADPEDRYWSQRRLQ